MVLRRLRALCLALPETRETSAWGHPNFCAGRRTFVAFERVSRRPSIAFRLDPSSVARLLGRRPFFATPYGRGRWVSLWADAPLDGALGEQLARRSYRQVALKRMLVAVDRRA